LPPEVTVPDELKAQQGQGIAVPGVSVTDVNAGSNGIQVTLGVDNGTLQVSTSGVTVNGNNSDEVTITGSLSAVNAVLGGSSLLTYTSNSTYHGPDLLAISAEDLGDPTEAGGLTGIGLVPIYVKRVDDSVGFQSGKIGVSSYFAQKDELL
jgi:hypothetical protein